jgi:chemotaxis receptor (MCP) glutamine deamidase CheD
MGVRLETCQIGSTLSHVLQVTEPAIPEVLVAIDQYEITSEDVVLVAHLKSTLALCIYDAVHESGALLHFRIGPPGRANDPDLTDTTLSSDLLLLDGCLSDLSKREPKAKHWQAKVAAQIDDLPGARTRLDGVQHFLTAFLADTDVKLVSCNTYVDRTQVLSFRPAMGHVRTEAK